MVFDNVYKSELMQNLHYHYHLQAVIPYLLLIQISHLTLNINDPNTRHTARLNKKKVQHEPVI